MKFNFDIECTPDEARSFFGMPNVVPMQERMMQELEGRLQENLSNLTPDEMVKTWMPATMQGWGEMQKMFWGQMGMTPPDGSEKK
ncbi:MAG: hypothetical protein KAJ40_01345 [Alphaproteobacteria bacterium]|nr:hypothetical protein [Alphaproteobacteria bacterium]